MKKLIFLIAMIVFATIYDRWIAFAIYDASAQWADVFYIYGELPSMFVTSIAFALLAQSEDRFKWLHQFLSFFVGTWAGIQVANHGDYNRFLWAMIAFAITIGIHLTLSKRSFKDLEKYHNVFLVVAWTGLLAWLSPQVIKLIWYRPRPYRMFAGDSFQAWYVGFRVSLENAYKSFPSGHSAVAASLLSLTQLKSMMKKSHYCLLKWSIVIFVILIMISRMVRGDHFLSDVLFGGILTFVILNCILFKQKNTQKT